MNTLLINEFKLHYADKSENTLKRYEKSVKEFYEFMATKRGCQTEEEIVNKTDWSCCQMFRNGLIAKNLNPKTVNNYLSGLRTYFNFLVLTRHIEKNPFTQVEQVSTKSVAEYDRPYIEGQDFDKLIQTIQTKVVGKKQDAFELTSTRDSLAVSILLTCGLRISELLNIKDGDIDENTGVLTVLGKGRKVRRVKIGTDNLTRLQEYLYVRKSYSKCDYLFVNRYGNKITPQAMNKNLKKYLERAGLNTDVSPHGLRHSCASKYINEGVLPVNVQKLLGHSSLDTTMKYYVTVKDDFNFIN
jgi:site-specific recombinase XerD